MPPQTALSYSKWDHIDDSDEDDTIVEESDTMNIMRANGETVYEKIVTYEDIKNAKYMLMVLLILRMG